MMNFCPKCREQGKYVLMDTKAVFVKPGEPIGYYDEFEDICMWHGGGECSACGYKTPPVLPPKDKDGE